VTNVVPFNPLDKRNLGASIGEALIEQAAVPLASLPRFDGAGIYAIYYHGTFEAYQALADCNKDGIFNVPIYVGKAIPQGSRRGGTLESPIGPDLRKRLQQHAKSIERSSNLEIEDFHCRFLVVDDVFISLGESLTIARFGPLWNSIIDGFGNNAPGVGRGQGMRPRWDTLHPGRAWAETLPPRPESAADIAVEAREYLRNSLQRLP